MFKNYFFVPANKEKFLVKSNTLDNIDHRIFDLEDSILSSELENAFKLLTKINIKNTDWIRIPLIQDQLNQITKNNMKIGINNYVIPKFEGFKELQKILDIILNVNPEARFILLIENAKSYIDLEKSLSLYSNHIEGISLGIHDFSFSTGIKNDYQVLHDIRLNIMLLATAYSVNAIDIVSTNTKNDQYFKAEVLDGFNIGYRSKFLIHPQQLEAMKSIDYYSKDEINEYKNVLEYFSLNIEGKEALFSFKNKVYEKMHIQGIIKIVQWGNEFYGTNGKKL